LHTGIEMKLLFHLVTAEFLGSSNFILYNESFLTRRISFFLWKKWHLYDICCIDLLQIFFWQFCIDHYQCQL